MHAHTPTHAHAHKISPNADRQTERRREEKINVAKSGKQKSIIAHNRGCPRWQYQGLPPQYIPCKITPLAISKSATSTYCTSVAGACRCVLCLLFTTIYYMKFTT